MNPGWVWVRGAVLLAVPVLVSCYAGTRGQPTGDGEEDTVGEAGDDDAGPEDPIPEGCVAEHAPIRRLSQVEYANTLRDLLPAVDLPALSLAADPRVGGFSNNAGALTPSDLLMPIAPSSRRTGRCCRICASA